MGLLKKDIDWMAVMAYGLFILLVAMMIVTAILQSDEARERAHCRLTCIDKDPSEVFLDGECWCDLDQEDKINTTTTYINHTNDKL